MRRRLAMPAFMLGLAIAVAGIVIAMFPQGEARVALPVAITVAPPGPSSAQVPVNLGPRGTTTTTRPATRGGGADVAAVNENAGTVGFRIPRKKAVKRAKRPASIGATSGPNGDQGLAGGTSSGGTRSSSGP